MPTILVLDQWCGVNPRSLQLNPVTFEALVQDVMHEPQGWTQYTNPAPQLLTVSDEYFPPFGTVSIRANAEGIAEIWKMNVDSSG